MTGRRHREPAGPPTGTGRALHRPAGCRLGAMPQTTRPSAGGVIEHHVASLMTPSARVAPANCWRRRAACRGGVPVIAGGGAGVPGEVDQHAVATPRSRGDHHNPARPQHAAAAATTDPRVQRHDMLQIREPRVDPEPAGHRGQIDQPAVTAHVLGHRDQQPTGPQHRVTRRIHHSHRSAECVAASVPEIRRVGVIASRSASLSSSGRGAGRPPPRRRRPPCSR